MAMSLRRRVRGLEAQLCANNVDVASMAYLTNSRVMSQMKTCDESATNNQAKWVWQGSASNAKVNSYRAEVSNSVAKNFTCGTATTITSPIIAGSFNDCIIASFNNGVSDWTIDPYVLATQGIVRIIVRHWFDFAVRRNESFCVLRGVLTP